jgi:LuxR family maltose regulon positive regulatory protein
MARSLPRVEDGVLYPPDAAVPIALDSPAWYTWLDQHTSFTLVAVTGAITIRKERGGYWKGYRRQAGKVRTAYVGRSPDLNRARLEATAQALGGAVAASSPPSPPQTPLVADLIALPRTKFIMPPPRPGRVERRPLLLRLRADPLPCVTLVAAPAGCGKTTLIADWLTLDQRTAAWLTLDAGDNDPVAFWTAVATALDMVQPGVGTPALALLRAAQPPPIATIITILINELSAHLRPDAAGRPVLLVLDDYHTVTQRAIHETMLTLIERLPPPLRLVVISRIDPPLRLARLRVRADLLEIRAAHLLFNQEEVAVFLTDTMHLSLPAEAAPILTARTEGWVAALQLAALSLRHQTDPAAFLATFGGNNRHLLSYLIDEVLSQQSPELQAFLLATSVLDRLCAELCAAVITEGPAAPETAPPSEAVQRAQALLEELNVANLFLIPLDTVSHWYRYHTLFAEALQHRLHQHDPAGERVYRRRASAWYAQAGHGSEAIKHALAAQDWALAGRWIERFVDGIRRRGEWRLLDVWLGALPPEWLRTQPELGFWQAARLMAKGQFIASEAMLTDVEHNLARAPAAPEQLLAGRTTALRSLCEYLLYGDPGRTANRARAALDQLPPDDWEWRALALVDLAAADYLSDDLGSARQHFQEAIALSEPVDYHFLTLLASARLGTVLSDGGALRDAQATADQAAQRAATAGILDLPIAGHVLWLAARLRYEANDLPAAAQLTQQAITRAEQGYLIELEGLAQLTWSQISLAQGDPEGAAAAVDQAEARLVPTLPGGAPTNEALRAALAAWRGTIALAAAPGRTGGPGVSGPVDAPAPDHPLAHWIWRAAQLLPARLRLYDGDAAGAAAYLEHLSVQAASAGAQGLLITALALEAIALDALGRRGAARTTLLRALDLSAPQGYIRAVLDAGPPISPLLQTLAHELTRAPETRPAFLTYVGQLRDAAGWDDPGPSATSGPAVPPRPLPPAGAGPLLTSREQAILRLLESGSSNQEIADRLIIGVSTVKWYLREIYEKLGSANRTQAVARARALGYLR